MTIGPLHTAGSYRQSVEEAVSAAIVSGEFPPGTMLTAPTLAARFDVSATPVREALLNLEKRGFVEIARNKGFRVTEVSEQELEQIVQIRQWLEAPAMRLLAGKIEGQVLTELRAQAEDIVTSADASALQTYLAADTAFHLHLLSLTGNDRLVTLVGDLRQQTRLVGLANMLGTSELARSSAEHHTLLDLLVAGEGAAAEGLMRVHIGHVTGWWSGRPEGSR
ncbi:GntR family transcriptional regulator [Paractinoplanes atraurantiacus]|uniref:DNA-binding transcriptional regulator, GntR family n=1 Tax=Paractinoplanes atraurantiacus TaxID=1036182 RepID=A0A285IIQ4_9ACTN|nr:GntR family transcriptional regulator [Actinoplanes atraurantiacus]SNY47865.1 DNA-binding transcriptional regulator, GntR family [Actinoplanes atraurantiacus]